MKFQKGQIANPRGRKTVREEIAPWVGVAALARPHAIKAMQKLVDGLNSVDEDVVVKCSKAILDYAETLGASVQVGSDANGRMIVMVNFGKSNAGD